MNIVVWIESKAGELKSPAIEALGVARKLADASSGEVTGVICEASGTVIPEEYMTAGAHHIVTRTRDDWDHCANDTIANEIVSVCESQSASCVIGAATTAGKEVLSLVAGSMGVPVAADCVDVSFENGTLEFHDCVLLN